jgi:hypothetical protein
VRGGIRLADELLKSLEIENDEINSLGSDLLALSDRLERRPNYPLELLLRKLILLQQINHNVDDTSNEMIELEQIQKFGDDDLDDDPDFEVIEYSCKSLQKLELLFVLIAVYLVQIFYGYQGAVVNPVAL